MWGTFGDIEYIVLSYEWEFIFTRLLVLAWCVSFLYSRELDVWKLHLCRYHCSGTVACRSTTITPYPHLPGVCFRPRLVCGTQCNYAITRYSQIVWRAKDKLVRLHDEASSRLATLTFFLTWHMDIVLAQPLWLDGALKSPVTMSWWVMVLDTTVKSLQNCVLSFHTCINTMTSLLFSIIMLRVSNPAAVSFLIPRCDLSLCLGILCV